LVKRRWPFHEVWADYSYTAHHVASFVRRRSADDLAATLTQLVDEMPECRRREAEEAEMFARMKDQPIQMPACTADCAINCTHSGVILYRGPHVVTEAKQ
jgi:hypothetical protein